MTIPGTLTFAPHHLQGPERNLAAGNLDPLRAQGAQGVLVLFGVLLSGIHLSEVFLQRCSFSEVFLQIFFRQRFFFARGVSFQRFFFWEVFLQRCFFLEVFLLIDRTLSCWIVCSWAPAATSRSGPWRFFCCNLFRCGLFSRLFSHLTGTP